MRKNCALVCGTITWFLLCPGVSIVPAFDGNQAGSDTATVFSEDESGSIDNWVTTVITGHSEENSPEVDPSNEFDGTVWADDPCSESDSIANEIPSNQTVVISLKENGSHASQPRLLGLPACLDIGGQWGFSSQGSVTCTIDGKTNTVPVSGTGDASIRQESCGVSWLVSNHLRKGTISADRVQVSGIFVVATGEVNYTQNLFTASGRACGNRMKLFGSGNASGTVRDPRGRLHSFSCVGQDRTVFNRKNPLNAVFKEVANSRFGWDDYTDPTLPSKSVALGRTDVVKAEITPKRAHASCTFASANKPVATVSPARALSSLQTVTVAGIRKGVAEIRAKACLKIIRKFSVATYKKKSRTVAVTLVHEKKSGPTDLGYTSTNISDDDIKFMLKKVFRQAIVSWQVYRQPEKIIEFDLNNDGMLDVDSWMTPEMAIIRDSCGTNYDYNIFIVDNPTDTSTGFMSFNQKYGFVHPNTGGDAQTLCHELGHGAGGLNHTPDDSMNVMYNYKSDIWRLRKNQWDQLNP